MKKKLGPFEVEIPCNQRIIFIADHFFIFINISGIDGIGSCLYDDVCQLLPKNPNDCPDVLIKEGIPCQCPFRNVYFLVFLN
jgi:hypothetical protein